MMEERLQKIMAQAGLGSRRACEALIAEGRVTVDGVVATLGAKADPTVNRILVDDRPIKTSQPLIYIAIHKPRGVLSTVVAPDPRPTVRNLVPIEGNIYPVGRLDVDSEGLILLTNDGDLANRLMHPRYGHEKEYKVLIASHPDENQLETWRRGVVLEDGYRTAPAQVWIESRYGKGTWLRVTLREGRKRLIREVGARLGLTVVKILRVRIGSLRLGNLKPREWRHLTPDEIALLKGLSTKDKTPRQRSDSKPKKRSSSARPRYEPKTHPRR